ncbi:MAG: hypothetical protein H6622_15260 [Halobacteriovoraceae bacterium]|nr:hypothetical protein [Halobacteriovoraceae bacterium]
MAKRREKKQFYFYECSITGEKFKTTREAPHAEELLSVKAFYEMNPEEDDRPEAVKKSQAYVEPEPIEEEAEEELED